MPITFTTQTVAEYGKEFPSKTAFKKASCSICLCSIKAAGQTLIWAHEGIGNTRHAHHIECLTPWLAIKNRCPCCSQKNIPSWKLQARTICDRIFVNGLGAGLIVGASGFLNNACFTLTDHPHSTFWSENNTLFAAALAGGCVESLLHFNDPFVNTLNKTRFVFMSLLTGINFLLNGQNPLIAIGSTGAMFLASGITYSLHKAGATMRGLAVPMAIACCISSLTSASKIPLPIIPLTTLTTLLGIIGSFKKD